MHSVGTSPHDSTQAALYWLVRLIHLAPPTPCVVYISIYPHHCTPVMLRRFTPRCAPKVPSAQKMNTQQDVLEINSPMALLRMCYRSIDIRVKSRHARTFLKKRLIDQWSEKSKETDPAKQRFYMDLAGSFLQALHTERNPKPGMPFKFQLSRRAAHEQKMQEKAEKAASGPRRVRRLHPDNPH